MTESDENQNFERNGSMPPDPLPEQKDNAENDRMAFPRWLSLGAIVVATF
jgi:hypothetical protein